MITNERIKINPQIVDSLCSPNAWALDKKLPNDEKIVNKFEPHISGNGGNSNLITDIEAAEISSTLLLASNKKSNQNYGIRKNLKSLQCQWKVPWFILTNTLVQAIIYSLSKDELFDLLLYSPYRKYEIWRFLSYTLLHSDLTHLLLNVALQFLIAFVLETEQGHIQILFVYAGGSLAGSLGTSIFQPTVLMVGSSAGVYSLLTSHIPHLLLNFSNLSLRYFRILAVIILCICDILTSVYHFLHQDTVEPKISVAAHISGAIFGVLLGFIFYTRTKTCKKSKTRIDFVLRIFSTIMCLVCIIAAIVINYKELIKIS